MAINDLPAIMGAVLIVAGLALVGIYARSGTGGERNVQAGALLIVVGAVLLGLSLCVSHAT